MLRKTLVNKTEDRDLNPMLITASEDHVRVHCALTADVVNTPCVFSSNRVNQILNDPSKYEICVESFTLAGPALPAFFRRIVFETTMPVSQELEEGTKNVQKSIIGYWYSPDLSSTVNTYDPYERRWFDLKSDYPLYNFDLRASFEFGGTATGITNPILLSPGQWIDIQILFRKKK
jgi:hypothetical protein